MGASDYLADLLKPFPLLQLLVGVPVLAAVIIATLRGARENKRDAHIAPSGHDPHGFAFFHNQALMYFSLMTEHGRQVSSSLNDLRAEQVKTNERLDDLQSSHVQEMARLRDSVDRVGLRPRR